MKKNLINLNIKKLFYDISEVFDKINSSSTYILTSMNKPKKPCPMDFVFYKCNSKCKRLKIIWNVDKNFIPHGLGLEKLDFIKKLFKNKYKNLNLSKYEKFKNMIDSKEITDAKILNFLKNKTSKKEQKKRHFTKN